MLKLRPLYTLLLILITVCSGALHVEPARAQTPTLPSNGKPDQSMCNEDAMLVFDASGSMAGNERLGIGSVVTRIDKVRKALGKVLPIVAPNRRIGLVTYGPGPYNRCDNVEINLKPAPNAASTIMTVVEALVPAGRTPLTNAVEDAADALQFRTKPGTIVLLTDGEETCGGNPCALAKKLAAEAKQLTVHVIGYRMKDFSWTGGTGMLDTRCLSDQNGGTYTRLCEKPDPTQYAREA